MGRPTEAIGLTTDVPNIQTIREEAVRQEKEGQSDLQEGSGQVTGSLTRKRRAFKPKAVGTPRESNVIL